MVVGVLVVVSVVVSVDVGVVDVGVLVVVEPLLQVTVNETYALPVEGS